MYQDFLVINTTINELKFIHTNIKNLLPDAIVVVYTHVMLKHQRKCWLTHVY